MSLGYIYLCCDDGECYDTEFVEGDGWAISLEEFHHDEFWIAALPRPKGQPRDIPRPKTDPMELIERLGLPIQKLISNGHHGDGKGREWAVYTIHWREGQAFPRRLLPDEWKPRQRHNCGEGTYACYTKRHDHWKRQLQAVAARQEGGA